MPRAVLAMVALAAWSCLAAKPTAHAGKVDEIPFLKIKGMAGNVVRGSPCRAPADCSLTGC
jgi:hypothetical protein